jgi:hypothetical protein
MPLHDVEVTLRWGHIRTRASGALLGLGEEKLGRSAEGEED